MNPTNSSQHQPWLKLAALILVIAALGLPINGLFGYAVLVVATVLIVAGSVAAQARPWLAAVAIHLSAHERDALSSRMDAVAA